MKNAALLCLIAASVFYGCKPKTTVATTSSEVVVAGAMRNVMWKGDLSSTLHLDTISQKKGLYGIGPMTQLQGEILIMDGGSWVGTVLTDSTMNVMETYEARPPFFVYAYVHEWEEIALPNPISSATELAAFLDEATVNRKRPFAFKLEGMIDYAQIHLQNLPEGTRIQSPEDAHRGQVVYPIAQEAVSVVGFFSTQHQGIFTHHDSFVHMHLITDSRLKMGHIDSLQIGKGRVQLFLPKE